MNKHIWSVHTQTQCHTDQSILLILGNGRYTITARNPMISTIASTTPAVTTACVCVCVC